MQVAAIIRRLARDERGVTLIEYGMIAALIAIVLIVSLQGLANSTSASLNAVSSEMQNAG